MHGSKAAKVTDESEYSGRRKTLLPRLASSKDWRQWAFKTETILKQKELWYVIENAAPAREVVALSANETARREEYQEIFADKLTTKQQADGDVAWTEQIHLHLFYQRIVEDKDMKIKPTGRHITPLRRAAIRKAGPLVAP